MAAPLTLLPHLHADWPAQAGLRIRGFLRWWGGELIAMLPGCLRRRSLLSQDTLVLHLLDSHIEAVHISNGTARNLGQFGVDDASALPPGLRRALQHDLTDLTRVIVRLPKDKTLQFTLRLPVAARENIREILGYEMDRYTPLTADQVCFDQRTFQASGEHLRVAVSVAPREALEQAIHISQRLGLRLHALDIASDATGADDAAAAGINLLPAALRPHRYSRRQLLNRCLLALAVLLTIIFASTPFWHQSLEIQALTRAVEEARAEADAAFALRDRRDAMLASLKSIQADNRSLPPILGILGELTERIPDDTWLQRLDIKNGQIQIQGISGNSSSLIGVLDGSKLLENVEFRSPVTQDARSGKENFQITAGLARRTPE